MEDFSHGEQAVKRPDCNAGKQREQAREGLLRLFKVSELALFFDLLGNYILLCNRQ
ncbi:hypothetical protein GCM10011297_23700 [Bacterioplanes sanyensis]|nr:hypothetical protein GCM10011297_23700 [Bacterioplanes sanyensis]